MGEIKYRIGLGADTAVDIDGALPPEQDAFMANSTLIFANFTNRYANETL